MQLNEKLEGVKLILASQSPRRKDLMCGCGLDFTVAENYLVNEDFPEELTAAEVPCHLAKLKSASYPQKLGDKEILITADTVVVLGEDILGKPKDREEAVEMLTRLSGEKHTVITGVVIRSARHAECFSVKTDVWFRKLREKEIEYYVDTYKPYDKAGAYGIQEWIGYIGIGRIEGSFYNVMGLPIQSLYVNLEKFVDEYF